MKDISLIGEAVTTSIVKRKREEVDARLISQWFVPYTQKIMSGNVTEQKKITWNKYGSYFDGNNNKKR